MEAPKKPQAALFQVYLRLRPAPQANQLYPILTPPERFLAVEEATEDEPPRHITLNPPNDNRRRAVEKFAFTKVFEEGASQLDLFQGTGVLPLVEGVLGPQGGDGRDGLLATLGVTGSGKTHTILGSRSQRGLTQLALDVLFRSISSSILDTNTSTSLHSAIAASDPSEAQVMSAQMFLDTFYSDSSAPSRASSRAPTPMAVRKPSIPFHPSTQWEILGLDTDSPKSIRIVKESIRDESIVSTLASAISRIPSYMSLTSSKARKYNAKFLFKGESNPTPTPRRNRPQRPSVLPTLPDIGSVTVAADPNAEYAILISMYEVYNDRIFDLLTPGSKTTLNKDFRRRPLLFKPTEQSPDRKVVAGLRKIICGTMKEALMVLEAGLYERRVAGTGSNSVSSRSHGFFCVEVKKRRRSRMMAPWGGSALTIVDLAGSERARDAKTQGATLVEAGKINESLMYLGQCLQMQSDLGDSTKPNLVPFRQCKLTELLFSNSFPSSLNSSSASSSSHHRNPQKAVMIVTADPLGDFNATSQILRYSALAREITVPRIPSVSSTILANCSSASNRSNFGGCGRTSPSDTDRETMEIAAMEIARMSEEIDALRSELAVEQQRRIESEAHLLSMEDRVMEVEQEIREECYQEMEKRIQIEMTRWKATWAAEADRNDEHIDRKLEILTRSIDIDNEEEDENKENVIVEGLEDENRRLKKEIEILRRDIQARSPSKSMRIPLRDSTPRQLADLSSETHNLRLSEKGTPTSPVKKTRKLTARKWDLVDEDDLF